MTETQTRIVQLFKTLPPTDQRALIEHLAETAQIGSFYERLSADQRAQLDDGIAQAERGETVSAVDVFDSLAKRFGFSNA